MIGTGEVRCPLCKERMPSMRDLMLHLLIAEMLKDEGYSLYGRDSLIRKCFCGVTIGSDLARDVEMAIMTVKEHITGRVRPGVSSDNITLAEVEEWPCYVNYLMGRQDKGP